MRYSIITINYNDKEGLNRTIKSVINQTSKDFEYIVIDGGSTDGSVDIIKQNADHINYWVSEKDKGVYNAMNKGIAQAKGDYLVFIIKKILSVVKFSKATRPFQADITSQPLLWLT